MRAVVDTNVLIRATLRPQGGAGVVLTLIRDGRLAPIHSRSMRMELVEVLRRPRLRDKYSVTETDIGTLLRLIWAHGIEVEPERTVRACRDPKDDKFLEAAVAGNAELIVTSDEDLLDLGSFEGIPIVSLATFIERLQPPSHPE